MIVRWKSIEKHRGRYFVKYIPASPSMYIATLVITYVDDSWQISDVISDMKKELNEWLHKFAIPIMTRAVDSNGNHIDIGKGKSTLWGIINEGVVSWSWEMVDDSWFPEYQKKDAYKFDIYKELVAITRDDIDRDIEKTRTINRTAFAIALVWIFWGAIMTTIAFYNIFFFGTIALLYCYYKVLRKILEMFGCLKRSAAEEKKTEDESEMRHHHLHCKMNPDGFVRLRNENFKKMKADEIRQDSERIRLLDQEK